VAFIPYRLARLSRLFQTPALTEAAFNPSEDNPIDQ
jgi:hypothetical protein